MNEFGRFAHCVALSSQNGDKAIVVLPNDEPNPPNFLRSDVARRFTKRETISRNTLTLRENR
jgi:hypothetical protein